MTGEECLVRLVNGTSCRRPATGIHLLGGIGPDSVPACDRHRDDRPARTAAGLRRELQELSRLRECGSCDDYAGMTCRECGREALA